jgi:hypothetical protein
LAQRSRQSILKRQRELKKAEKAEAKRQKRAERRHHGDVTTNTGPSIDKDAAPNVTGAGEEDDSPALAADPRHC